MLVVLRVATFRPLPLSGESPVDGYTRVAGVVHVHTTLSDGGGVPSEVIAAARKSGLGFLGITDHNNLDAKPAEGYHGPLLVLVGSELSTTAGHLVGLGIDDPVYRFSGDARDGLEDVRDLGGASFAAHPTSPRDDLRWTGWDLPGPWGLELLNGDSEWRRASWGRLARLGALYAVNARYALLSGLTPPKEALARWDALLARRDVSGIVGADAHSRVPITKKRSLRFPSYEALFGLARNHVLLPAPLRGEAGPDAVTIVEALRRGRAYVGLDALAAADGFSFTAESLGRRFTMGDEVVAGPEVRFSVRGRMPAGARIILLRDGQPLAESEPPLTLSAPGPGVYRVEARIAGWDVPWILTNPIYVFDPPVQEARSAKAAWPHPAPAPSPAAVLDDFEGHSIFAPEHDPSSTMALPVLEPGAGVDGGGAGRLAFRLGIPGPAHPHTWCSLVNREARDLRGRTGLVFGLRADGVYRLWVQVRDANPASADEGTEWWFASVRTGREWRRVVVPFAGLRSVNPRTDGRLDLDQVKALLFTLDRGAVKPGSSGSIWIDDVGLY
ncbi:MAG TPA: CehA/McbA family metallohydrolase [Vicinamibacteria bacterium]